MRVRPWPAMGGFGSESRKRREAPERRAFELQILHPTLHPTL